MQNMVLAFIQVDSATLATILEFGEMWNVQCTLMKQLAQDPDSDFA